MSDMHFLYFADPMCSWCYGFSPVIGALAERYKDRLPVRLVMGGLRAGNTQAMRPQEKDYIRGAWTRVGEASGQPFDFAFFDREGFVYDTEPACRAVVTVRQHAPALALAMYHAIQQAFYADGRDVTKAAVLGEVWDEVHGRSKQAWGHIDFLRDFESAEIRQLTRDDFAQAQRWGVRGFPALLARHDGQLRMIAGGYTDADTLIEALAALAGPRDGTP